MRPSSSRRGSLPSTTTRACSRRATESRSSAPGESASRSGRASGSMLIHTHAPHVSTLTSRSRRSSGSQTLGIESLGAVHQRVGAVDVPSPAVERARDLAAGGASGAAGTAASRGAGTRCRTPSPSRRAGGRRRSIGRRSRTPPSRRVSGSPRGGTPSARRGATGTASRARRTRGRNTAHVGRAGGSASRTAPETGVESAILDDGHAVSLQPRSPG